MSRVLLLEPDCLLARAYIEALRGRGHEVNWATNAQVAINLADQTRPDIVIVEVQLVEHSGIEFLYELRSYDDWQDLPAIIHSQVPVQEFFGCDTLLSQELGVRTYLYKPRTTLKDLLACVSQLSYQTA